MSKLSDLLREAEERHDRPFISFEFFPPRTDEGLVNLYRRIGEMAAFHPLFIDCTWGAGGSTSTRTFDICSHAQKQFGLTSNMHITCTNVDKKTILETLQLAKNEGIRNILALRGDPPRGQEKWESTDSSLACALDLVRLIRATFGDYFCIGVSGYTEGHPTTMEKVADGSTLTESEKERVVHLEDGEYVCRDEAFDRELAYLKEKVDAGGDFVVTQMIMDSKVYTSFVRQCRAIGILCPIIPGVLCIQNYAGFERTCSLSKSHIPQGFVDAIYAEDDKRVREVSVELLTALCRELLMSGAPGIHFYTLNSERVCTEILDGLGYHCDLPRQTSSSEADIQINRKTLLSIVHIHAPSIALQSFDDIKLAGIPKPFHRP